MRRRLISLLWVAALCAVMFFPIRATETVCFTAVNDRILPLTATMPVWSGGGLYVPYHVFDANTTGVSMGTNSTYNKSSGIVNVFSLQHMMIFDLEKGTCKNQHTGEDISARAIIRNGTAYVPVSQVCTFFGLNSAYLSTDYGYLVRITNYDKSDKRTLSDSALIDAGSNIMKNRLKEYKQSLVQEQTPPAVTEPVQPVTPEQTKPSDVATYLAVLCRSGEGAPEMARQLEQSGLNALFFFPAEEMGSNGDLIRRLLGCGHSVGILAEGEDARRTQELLELGSATLSAIAHTRTYYAMVPEDQRSQLAQSGWIFWSDEQFIPPAGEESVSSYAHRVVQKLPEPDMLTLTMGDTQADTQLLPALLRQLKNSSYIVTIPRETALSGLS